MYCSYPGSFIFRIAFVVCYKIISFICIKIWKSLNVLLNNKRPMIANGDLHNLKAFSEFFQKNQSKFIAFTYSYIRNKDEAEDILMESMASLWENRDKWEKESNIPAILLTIIKNKALNYLAHEQVRLNAENEINSHQQRELNFRISTLKECNPDTIFKSEIQTILEDTLKKLPEQSRRIFILSRFDNLSNKQIAETLGVSIKTVEFHVTRTLKILRHDLKDYLISIFF